MLLNYRHIVSIYLLSVVCKVVLLAVDQISPVT